jgi:uncharacterized protein YciI
MFEDNEKEAGKRGEFMQEHLAFLRSRVRQISAAGPLKDAESGLPAGGLWLVSADSRAEVIALVMADPFWPTGLRKSFKVLEWTKVHVVAWTLGDQSFERSSGSDGPSQIT